MNKTFVVLCVLLILYVIIIHIRNDMCEFSDVLYTEYDFPIRLAVLESGVRFPNDIHVLREAAREYNICLQFNIFDVETVTVIEQKEYGTRIDTLYVMGACYNHKSDHEPFDGPGKVLAHATLPPFKFLCIDSSDTWTDMKLYSTVLHELGHILGLQHTSNTQSIMFKYFRYVFSLYDRDIDLLRKIYPFMKKKTVKPK